MKAVVIDNGSQLTKIGLSTDIKPTQIFPTIVGRASSPEAAEKAANVSGHQKRSEYIGAQAWPLDEYLTLNHPIEKGDITDWDDLQLIWDHIYQWSLGVESNEYPVVLTEESLDKNQTFNRERIAQIFFEKYSVPSLYVGTPAYFDLIYSEKPTGIVVDSGDEITQIIPFIDYHPIVENLIKFPFGGKQLTQCLESLLNKRGIMFQTHDDREALSDIKKTLCYAASDFTAEIAKIQQSPYTTYTMPNGREIQVFDEGCRCGELLFVPETDNISLPGIHHALINVINKCGDENSQKKLYENIVLAGGTTMLKGLPERLQREVKEFGPITADVSVFASPDRITGAWNGSAKFANEDNFGQFAISSSEYKETGANIVRSKCNY